jgi:hypothetical protein
LVVLTKLSGPIRRQGANRGRSGNLFRTTGLRTEQDARSRHSERDRPCGGAVPTDPQGSVGGHSVTKANADPVLSAPISVICGRSGASDPAVVQCDLHQNHHVEHKNANDGGDQAERVTRRRPSCMRRAPCRHTRCGQGPGPQRTAIRTAYQPAVHGLGYWVARERELPASGFLSCGGGSGHYNPVYISNPRAHDPASALSRVLSRTRPCTTDRHDDALRWAL